MTLQMIDLGLLDVAYVAYSQGRLPDREVECEKLAYGWLVVRGGETNVLAEILGERHLIIRLSVFGREHHAQQRYIQLIAEHERMFLDAEMVNGHSRCSEIHVCFGIHRIVRVPHVVNHSSVQVEIRTGQQFPLLVLVEGVMVGQVPVGEEGELASRPCLVLRERYVGLKQALACYLTVQIFGRPSVLAEDTKLRSGVFHRREVGIQQIGMTDAVERGTHHVSVGLQTILLCLYVQEAQA